jgi:hypothetical protein
VAAEVLQTRKIFTIDRQDFLTYRILEVIGTTVWRLLAKCFVSEIMTGYAASSRQGK